MQKQAVRIQGQRKEGCKIEVSNVYISINKNVSDTQCTITQELQELQYLHLHT